MSKGVVVVVLGYRTSKGLFTHELIVYLQKVVKFVAENNVRAIVLTGGRTAQSSPWPSEAAMIEHFLWACYVDVEIYTDELAQTTLENIENTEIIIKDNCLDHFKRVFFCDHCRNWKVKILVRKVVGYYPRTITHDVTKIFIKKVAQICVATPLNVGAAYIPALREWELKRKEWLVKNN